MLCLLPASENYFKFCIIQGRKIVLRLCSVNALLIAFVCVHTHVPMNACSDTVVYTCASTVVQYVCTRVGYAACNNPIVPGFHRKLTYFLPAT